MRRRWTTIAVLAVFALLGTATMGDDEESGGGESESAEPSSDALAALEAHLTVARDYGEGPDGELIAGVVREALAPGDAVAVKVIPGTPRRIVVLVRYSSRDGYEDLRDIPSRERNAELDRVIEAIDGGYEAGGDELGVAIRGVVFYGAIAMRGAGEAVEYHTGTVISTRVLEPLLTGAPGPEPDHAIQIGSTLQGTLERAPRPQPFYHLTLAEPRDVRVRFWVDRTQDPPFAAVCTGTMRGAQCVDDNAIEPMEEVPEELIDAALREVAAAEERGETFIEDVYRLRAGSYTIGVFRGECDGACPNAGARYALELQ